MEQKHFPSEEDRLYKRIYGGVSWPGKRPGFACIVGQLREQTAKGYEMVFLDECEAGDIRELVYRCGAFDFYYRPEKWIGDPSNPAARNFIFEMNRENKELEKAMEGRRNFVLQKSPLLDLKNSFEYFFPVLKTLLEKDNRRLHLKESKLMSYMYQPQDGDIHTMDWGTFPAIESLVFAVLELDRTVNRPRKRQRTANNEYVRA